MAETNVVRSLFGPTPTELAKERAILQAQYLANASRVSPSYSAGAGLGSLISNVASKLFGSDPEMAKAEKMDTILKDVISSLPEEQRTNRTAILNKASEVLSTDPSLQREAIQVAYQAAESAKDDLNTSTNVAYKNALIKQADDSMERKNLATAYNVGQGLKSLLDANVDPEKFDAAYNSSIEKLKAKGIDTSFLEQAQDIEEKTAGVDYLISLGTSEKGRSSAAIAEKRTQLQERSFAYKQKLDEAKLEMQKYAIGSREHEAAKNRAAAMERALVTAGSADKRLAATENNLYTREALAERSKEIQGVDTEFQTKLDIKMLTEDFGLPVTSAQSAVKSYQGKVKDYLNMKDENGLPLYTVTKAQDLARQDFRKGVQPGTGFFGKPSYQKDTQTTDTSAPPISLLKEGQQTTFKNGQVWTLNKGKATRVK